ncbi:MAG TPA: PAS domain S-box protein, partial [Polyangiaceae bacterium]|nr:PAS domain S-box protein [Polyangiaceae bacterium]
MRLLWKTFFVSLGSVVLCTVLLTGIISYREADHSLARLRAEQRLLAVTAASQVDSGYAEHIWPFEMLSAIGKEADFVSWQIVDGEGAVVLSDRPVAKGLHEKLLGIAAPSDTPVRANVGDAIEFWIVPLHMRAQRNTWLFRLGYSTDSVRVQLRDIVLTNALAGLSLAILVAVASLGAMRHLLRPLDAVTRAAKRMGQGDLTVSLPPGGKDEIGELVGGFSAMVANVRERDAKITEHLESLERARSELETRVEARTSDLRKATAAAQTAAASLRESDTRMRGIIEYAADAIVTLNVDGCIEVYNPAAAEVFGYAPEEILGKPFQTLLPKGYRIDLKNVAIECEKDDARVPVGSSGEIHGRRSDGATFPMEFALSQVDLGEKRLFTAIVHDISERRRAQEELAELHRRLVEASRLAGKAEMASDVLHNVGNILNSVNVSAGVLAERIGQQRCEALFKVTDLLREHQGDLGSFVTQDPRGKLVPMYLEKLAHTMTEEQREVLGELTSLMRDVEHIKEIVSMQQSYARVNVDVREPVSLSELMDDALRIVGMAGLEQDLVISRDYAPGAHAVIDRHKTLQILVNLLSNAKHAIRATSSSSGHIVARVRAEEGDKIKMEVSDDGVGIPQENMVKIFHYG